ncbi:hypothetical protein BJ912DRAFT_693328 [Pholiota molesta]|nr:hypothetical protein BJ912DRAFT_693328 [Pholiota molesta]
MQNQSSTIPARVPTSPHPTQQLRKQHSAYTLGSVETGRGHGYHNYIAQGAPPLQELPPLQVQINNRKTFAGVSASPTTTEHYVTHTASPLSTSPQHSLLSAPSSPSGDKVLPPLPSSARASYHPPHAYGPRKTVSHSNMRFTHKRTRPATTEGAISPAGMSGNRSLGVGVGVGTGSGARQKERGGQAAAGERESEREDVTPWEFQSSSEPASASTSTRASSVAQSFRSRASSGVGATGPVAEVTPWEVHEVVEGELGGKEDGREGGKDARGREKAREAEAAIEEEDREYGVSRPMEFALGRARVSNVNTTNTGFVAASNGTGATSPLAPASRVLRSLCVRVRHPPR